MNVFEVEQDIRKVTSLLNRCPLEKKESVSYYQTSGVIDFEGELIESGLLDKYNLSIMAIHSLFLSHNYRRSEVDLAMQKQILDAMVDYGVTKIPLKFQTIMKENEWLEEYTRELKKSVIYKRDHLFLPNKTVSLHWDDNQYREIVGDFGELKKYLLLLLDGVDTPRHTFLLEKNFQKLLSDLRKEMFASNYISVLELRYNKTGHRFENRYHPKFIPNKIRDSFHMIPGDPIDNTVRTLFWIHRYKNLLDDDKKNYFPYRLQTEILKKIRISENEQTLTSMTELYHYLFHQEVSKDLITYEMLEQKIDAIRTCKLEMIEILIRLLEQTKDKKTYPYWGVNRGYDEVSNREYCSFSIVSSHYFEPLTFRIKEELYEKYKISHKYPLVRFSLPQALVRVYPNYENYLRWVLENDQIEDPKTLFHIYHILGMEEKREEQVPFLLLKDTTLLTNEKEELSKPSLGKRLLMLCGKNR